MFVTTWRKIHYEKFVTTRGNLIVTNVKAITRLCAVFRDASVTLGTLNSGRKKFKTNKSLRIVSIRHPTHLASELKSCELYVDM